MVSSGSGCGLNRVQVTWIFCDSLSDQDQTHFWLKNKRIPVKKSHLLQYWGLQLNTVPTTQCWHISLKTQYYHSQCPFVEHSKMIYAHPLLQNRPLSLSFILITTSCPLSSSASPLGEPWEFPHDNRNLNHTAYIQYIRSISLKGMKAL